MLGQSTFSIIVVTTYFFRKAASAFVYSWGSTSFTEIPIAKNKIKQLIYQDLLILLIKKCKHWITKETFTIHVY